MFLNKILFPRRMQDIRQCDMTAIFFAQYLPIWKFAQKLHEFATYQINSKNFPRLSKRQNLAKSEEALVLNAEGLTTSLDEYLILN